MKKITLVCIVALSMLSAVAQTKKSSKKYKKPVNKEAVAKAKFEKQEALKKIARDSTLASLVASDSTRKSLDSIAEVQKEADRLAFTENGLKAIDSANAAKYKAIETDRDNMDKVTASQNAITNAVNLSEYQKKQVKYINESYTVKAKVIEASEAADKAKQLAALNEERRAKIKTIVGKSKERKLEKERKNFVEKNGVDEVNAWIQQAESVSSK